jgi:hypothetical protein
MKAFRDPLTIVVQTPYGLLLPVRLRGLMSFVTGSFWAGYLVNQIPSASERPSARRLASQRGQAKVFLRNR